MTPAERRTLRLTIFDDDAGGLNFLLSDGRNLALHQRLGRQPAGATAAWQGDAWRDAAAHGGLLGFGLALAAALLPAPVREVLARQGGGWLHLQLGPRLLALPWELAALAHPAPADAPAWHLDERFCIVRQIMADAAPPDPLPHREPGGLLQVLHVLCAGDSADSARDAAGGSPQPGRFGPLLRRVLRHDPAATSVWQRAAGQADIVHWHHRPGQAGALDARPGQAGTPEPPPGRATGPDVAQLAALPQCPRLLLADGVGAGGQVPAWVVAACGAGFSALVLASPDAQAIQVFYSALAEGAAFGVAAQRARASARASAGPATTAWFYGDGQTAPLRLAGVRAGAAQASAPRGSAPPDDRRQITILAIDLVGSTDLMHRLGDEEYSERLTHYHRRVAETAQAHAGLADDPQGDDGFMCYFGYPAASEDAAAQALRAGLSLAGQFGDLGLQVRIGIATGQVVIRNAQPVGSAVHLAARLQQQAGPDGVLVAEATRQIAGERFVFSAETAVAQLKGFDEVGPVYRLHKEVPVQGTERFDTRAHLTPFTGREAELARLQQHWRRAAAGQRQALLLRGEAGIGKSRLVREFRRGLADAGHRTLECRCAPEHTGSAFQPMIDLLRKRLQIDEADAPALQLARLKQLQVTSGPQAEQALALLGHLMSIPAALLPPLDGAESTDSPEWRRARTMDLLAGISLGLDERAPVCLIVEDVHWIDPSTRELMQRLIDGPPNQRLMLLLTLRSSPVGAGVGAGVGPIAAAATDPNHGFDLPTMTLGGLGPDAARALLQGAVGMAMLDADLAGWLAQRADGVPLFIEESARMAAAISAQQPDVNIAAALRKTVPGTLQDLLMARLDQLPLAKRAAQLGSALGRVFTLALVKAVNGHADSPIRLPQLGAALDGLVQAGLLSVSQEGEHQHYSFKHALVRDAAYQSMLERDRRRLHGATAAVLQDQFAALCSSRPELLALHHQRAGMARAALAGWTHAARHAAQRSAHDEALAHLRRALALALQWLDQPGHHADAAALLDQVIAELARLRQTSPTSQRAEDQDSPDMQQARALRERCGA